MQRQRQHATWKDVTGTILDLEKAIQASLTAEEIKKL